MKKTIHAGEGAAGEEDEGKESGSASNEPELLTWTTILCRRSTLTACMAYVLTSCIYIVYGAHSPTRSMVVRDRLDTVELATIQTHDKTRQDKTRQDKTRRAQGRPLGGV